MNEQSLNWFAVNTRPRWEKKIASKLSEKGFENYCPLQKKVSQWSDRKKIVYEPIFKGYVFVKVGEENKWEIKKIDGILNYVYWLGKPAVIKESEIITIKKFLKEFDDIEVEKRPLNINEKVRVREGIMMNYEGILIEVSGNKAKVRIDSMGLVLSAYFEKKNLEPAKSFN